MKIVLSYIACILILVNCKSVTKLQDVSSIEIEQIFEQDNFSTRAIEVNENGFVFSANNNLFGHYQSNNNEFQLVKLTEEDPNIIQEFRSVSPTKNGLFALSVGNPARLFSVDFNTTKQQLQYEENHESVFYDSMKFWNEQEGIAFGDAVDGCMSVIITRDGGKTWNKLDCEDFFPSKGDHEGAFAASNTNIAIIGNHAWLASGTRIFHTADKGKTWKLYNTPIIQEKETQGIYSIDFYDKNRGIAIGGDYTAPDSNEKNLIATNDGGKTWQVISTAHSPGYRSCIQYIPNSNAKGLIAVGFKGIDVSFDSGKTWKHISDESFYTVRFNSSTTGYLAGKGRIAKFVLN